jgi:type II secretory pathway component GspD/PulD (secretin)
VVKAQGSEAVDQFEPTPVPNIKEVRATFHFRNMRLEEILKLFSRESGANFITDEKIRSMTFTAFLQNVTVREALDALLSSRGLSYEQYTKSSNNGPTRVPAR